MSQDSIPSDLRYTEAHEWIRHDGDSVVIGITAYAQDQLGDVVYLELPAIGAEFEAGQRFGEVESTKSLSELHAPISGVIADVNRDLESTPELVNSAPYGDGWMIRLRPADLSELDQLLSADEYQAQIS